MDSQQAARTGQDAESKRGSGSQRRRPSAKALFSEHYLRKRIQDHGEWALDVSEPFAKMKALYEEKRGILSELNEAQTEDEFIRPALKNLGFAYIPQTRVDVAGRARWPDYTLFRDQTAQEAAYPLQQDHVAFYARALAVCDAKFWRRPLNKILADDPRDIVRNTNPSFQMVMYLFGTRVDWGILTNGAVWRLYYREASSTATEFYEVDLVELLEADDPQPFKYFWLFFRRDAFVKDAQGRNFLERVREGSATYARVVGDRLRGLVFEEVFPLLSGGFVSCAAEREEDATTEDASALIYEASLSLLYKLLFLLYAEARNLLPMDNPGYRSQSATQLARDVARRLDGGEPFGRTSTALYDRLLNLCRMVDHGDRNLGLPRYNGGLFHFGLPDAAHPQEHRANWFLTEHRVSDDALAHAVDRLARVDGEPIDYGFIGVRHLGAIYEGLLEHRLVVDDAPAGRVHLETDKGERKATGSYYTPGHVVRYIIQHTLEPLLEERAGRFGALMGEIAKVRKQLGDGRRGARSISALRIRLGQLEREAQDELLDIKVCDPAMGSGHFLVEAVDFLTDGLVGVLNEYPEHNPVLGMLEQIRQDIEVSLRDQGIRLDRARLDDTQLLQRVVMKRCIYGVDANPMAVELAKVSLWLHSFTVGAPLSFLDHHLRRGDSLIGATAREAQEQLTGEMPMFGGPFAGLLRAAEIMRGISLLSDATFSEVEESERLFRRFDEAAEPYKQLLDVYLARHFGVKHADEFLRLYGADTIQAGPETVGEPYRTALRETRRLCQEKRFFHWDLEFPEVFIEMERATWKDNPGFDALVGNPPYDVLAEKELGYPVEDEKKFFRLHPVYDPAVGGKLNLYRLFACRALELLRNGGYLSFIVPLGLLGDVQAERLRRWILGHWHLRSVEAFPQKDDPHNRVFFDAKLSTCVFVLGKYEPTAPTRLRVHPGKHIASQSPATRFQSQDVLVFDPKTASIPIVGQSAWELALKLSKDSRLRPFGEIATSHQGEVNLTGHRHYRTDGPPGVVVLRGAHVGRYDLSEQPKQGSPYYLDVKAFLSDAGEHTKRFHHKHKRIVYQRGSAMDNWRRIIATTIDEGEFCSDTINYIVAAEYDLLAVLALLNASVAEWRFRVTSTSNHVNIYEINALPMPRMSFNTEPQQRRALVQEATAIYSRCLEGRAHTPLVDFVQAGLASRPEQTDVAHDILAHLAGRMLAMNRNKQAESKGFLDWLSSYAGLAVDEWRLKTIIKAYWEYSWDELQRALRHNRKAIDNASGRDIEGREAVEAIEKEFEKSVARLKPLLESITSTDSLIDLIVYRLYGLTEEEVAIVERAT